MWTVKSHKEHENELYEQHVELLICFDWCRCCCWQMEEASGCHHYRFGLERRPLDANDHILFYFYRTSGGAWGTVMSVQVWQCEGHVCAAGLSAQFGFIAQIWLFFKCGWYQIPVWAGREATGCYLWTEEWTWTASQNQISSKAFGLSRQRGPLPSPSVGASPQDSRWNARWRKSLMNSDITVQKIRPEPDLGSHMNAARIRMGKIRFVLFTLFWTPCCDWLLRRFVTSGGFGLQSCNSSVVVSSEHRSLRIDEQRFHHVFSQLSSFIC